ncbi:Uracil-DNA glycosylase [Gracilariopsis chorda]|uniref:Uracil-DNA glycosylase n=1 Tax=Gracilariopsis chorda TaxID=448386 RepID=A0A2V3ID72_9FLOR|nr:Uracil-DNA glycosylase [Gracilariopsis chorda]|eukprot:PXF40032.1 Uracil-DNA glycosylase [Gracilariopsis chorda]
MSSMRFIIKAAAMAKYNIGVDMDLAYLRKLISNEHVVSPQQWFQRMIAQGVLFFNASLTTGGSKTNSGHTEFWRPVLRCIIERILVAKSKLQVSDKPRGLVLCWWGSSMKKTNICMVLSNYRHLPVQQIDWYNPAARGEWFCRGSQHFSVVNKKMAELGRERIDWLPTEIESIANRKVLVPAALKDFMLNTKHGHTTYLGHRQGK